VGFDNVLAGVCESVCVVVVLASERGGRCVYPVVRFSGFALVIGLVLGLVYPVVPLFEPLGFVCLVAPAFEPLRLVSPLVGHVFELLELGRIVLLVLLGFVYLVLPLRVLVFASIEFSALVFEPLLLVIHPVWFTSFVIEPFGLVSIPVDFSFRAGLVGFATGVIAVSRVVVVGF
jgi:hypothetical protein